MTVSATDRNLQGSTNGIRLPQNPRMHCVHQLRIAFLKMALLGFRPPEPPPPRPPPGRLCVLYSMYVRPPAPAVQQCHRALTAAKAAAAVRRRSIISPGGK